MSVIQKQRCDRSEEANALYFDVEHQLDTLPLDPRFDYGRDQMSSVSMFEGVQISDVLNTVKKRITALHRNASEKYWAPRSPLWLW